MAFTVFQWSFKMDSPDPLRLQTWFLPWFSIGSQRDFSIGPDWYHIVGNFHVQALTVEISISTNSLRKPVSCWTQRKWSPASLSASFPLQITNVCAICQCTWKNRVWGLKGSGGPFFKDNLLNHLVQGLCKCRKLQFRLYKTLTITNFMEG